LDLIKTIEGSDMRCKLAVLAVLLLLGGSTVFADSTYYLPHLGIGSYTESGVSYGYSTTFIFFNNTTTNAEVTLNLINDDGTPMIVTIPELGTNSTFSFTLPQAATVIYETAITGTQRGGAATVTSDSPIGVSGVYTLYNNDTGAFAGEVGVTNANPLSSFVLPVQISGSSTNTGLALFNPSNSDAQVTLTLKNEDGTTAASNVIQLGKGKHSAFFLGGQQFSSVSNLTGTLTVSSTVAISAITLRVNAPTNPPAQYTSIPVVSTSSSQTAFSLAQFADGAGYKTTFMLFNPSTSTANVTIDLYQNDGTALSVTMTGGSSSASHFAYQLGAGQSKFVQTNGASGGLVGAVAIGSDRAIGAAGLFSQYNSDGSFKTEVGVLDSPAFTSFTLPIDSKIPLSDTGVALYNPTSESLTFSPVYLDQDGLSTTTNAITLSAHGHYSDYFSNIFPNQGVTQGTFVVSGLSSAISAMTIRLNNDPYNMTSLPVLEGATAGFQYSTAAVGGTATGVIYPNIAVSADTTFNKQINWGYGVRINSTGFPTSGSGINQVQMIATSGKAYKPYTVSAGATLYVGPGVYKVRTAGWVGTSTSVSGTWITYTAPDLVTITATGTTANVTLPTLTTYNVTGAIAGIDAIATATSSQMVFISTSTADPNAQYTVYCPQNNGSFTQAMPSGTYIAGIQAKPFGSTSGTENMGFLNIGTFTVEDSDLTVDLAIPATAKLSGAATFTGAPPSAITLTVKDSSAPVMDPTAGNIYAPFIAQSTWASPTAGFTGPYDMDLVKGRNYQIALSYSLYASTSTTVASGNVTYTPTLNAFTLAGDGDYDFDNVAVPSTLVTLSGKLTNSLGNVQGATVTAVSNALTGAANSTYKATAATATDGTWSMKVPKGSYKLYLSSYGTPFVVP